MITPRVFLGLVALCMVQTLSAEPQIQRWAYNDLADVGFDQASEWKGLSWIKLHEGVGELFSFNPGWVWDSQKGKMILNNAKLDIQGIRCHFKAEVLRGGAVTKDGVAKIFVPASLLTRLGRGRIKAYDRNEILNPVREGVIVQGKVVEIHDGISEFMVSRALPSFLFPDNSGIDRLDLLLKKSKFEYTDLDLADHCIGGRDLTSLICLNELMIRHGHVGNSVIVAILRNKGPEMRSVMLVSVLSSNSFSDGALKELRKEVLAEFNYDLALDAKTLTTREARERARMALGEGND